LLFELIEVFEAHIADRDLSCRFVQFAAIGALAFEAAGIHRATGHENGRDIDPGCRDQHARGDFIAIGDHDHGIELMAFNHGFDRVGNQLAAGQWVAHAIMAHGNAITKADDREFNADAALGGDPQLDMFGQFAQMDMAGIDFIERVDHCDEWLFQIFVRQAGSLEE